MKKFLSISLILTSVLIAQPEFSGISSMPGAFSRIGFGARGIAMGNSISSVKTGNLVSYYNPALASFQEGNLFQTAYSFLSLDRTLNFVSFTRKFEFGRVETPDGKTRPRSVAGISAGLINSGVSGIDGRDNQGVKTGDLSTSENQFFIAVSNRFSDKIAVGIAFKFYVFKLYEDFSSNGVGLDIGLLYSYNDALTFSFVMADINSKYEWDSGKIYGTSGSITKNKFPLLTKIGASYNFKEDGIITSIEFENSNAGSKYIRAGIEYNIFTDLFIRAGIDRINLLNSEIPLRPSFGFSYFYMLNNLKLGIDYAFVIEPYSSSDHHIIGVNINF